MAIHPLEHALLSGALSGAATRAVARCLGPMWGKSSTSGFSTSATITGLASLRSVGGVVIMDLAPASAAGSGQPPSTPAGVVHLGLPPLVQATFPWTLRPSTATEPDAAIRGVSPQLPTGQLLPLASAAHFLQIHHDRDDWFESSLSLTTARASATLMGPPRSAKNLSNNFNFSYEDDQQPFCGEYLENEKCDIRGVEKVVRSLEEEFRSLKEEVRTLQKEVKTGKEESKETKEDLKETKSMLYMVILKDAKRKAMEAERRKAEEAKKNEDAKNKIKMSWMSISALKLVGEAILSSFFGGP